MSIDGRISIVGLGTVGHVLACALAAAGFPIAAIDLNAARRDELWERLEERGITTGLVISATPVAASTHIIAVDTPLQTDGHTADLTHLRSAARAVGAVLRPGDLVIVRSTVPVGTVRDCIRGDLADSSGLTFEQFHLAYAPERCIVGDEAHELATLPQLLGALDATAARRARAIFERVTSQVVTMQAVEAAELAKLAHNAYSDLRHAFANQIGMIAEKYNLDAVRLIDEANLDYPRDPIARPSPGVGGSCLIKDPYLLAQSVDDSAGPNLFTIGRQINDDAAGAIVTVTLDFLRSLDPPQQVLVCGAAFKARPPTDDTRGSVGVAVARELSSRGVNVVVHDPCVSAEQLVALGLSPHADLFDSTRFDVALLLSDHPYYEGALADHPIKDLLSSRAMVYDPWHLVDPIALQRDAPGVDYVSIGYRSASDAAVSPAAGG